MADVNNQQVMSKLDALLERLKNRHQDKDFSDDEAMYGQIIDDFDEVDEEIRGYKERESSILDLFNRDPMFARFMVDAANAEDPWLAVIERIGIDGITALMNDPEKKAEYAAKNADYVARVAREKEIEDEYEKNKLETSELLDRIQDERGISDDVRNEIASRITRIAQDMVIGKVTPETVDMVLSSITHDADVENARSEGLVAGKNAKIEEKLRKRGSGDGIPAMGGGNSASGSDSKKRFNIFDYADAAN